ncbi:Transcription factor ICE1 [Glycine soja]
MSVVEWRHVPNNITHTREDDDNVIFSTNNVVAADIYYNLLQQQPLHTTNLKPTFYPLEMTSHVGFLDPQASFTSKADHDVFLSSSKSTEVLVDSKKRKTCNNIIGEGGSGLNYDSDEISDDNNKMEEISARNGGNSPNANSTITGGVHQKGKKTASILGDAIEYLKELLQRISELRNELESTPAAGASSSFLLHPLTPTTLPTRMQEELCLSSLPSPNAQPASARQRNEGQDVHPEKIKAVLLDSAGGFHSMT